MVKILIVEDNEMNMRLFSDLLKSKGYNVLQCPDGKKALSIVQAEHPDLVLMDIQMPGISGLEVTALIRQSPDVSKTKIIGVGAAIGFSRIFASMLENNQIDLTRFSSPIDVAVLVMGDNNVAYAAKIVNALRNENISAVSYLDTDKKFKNQIEYADKIGAKFAIIVGDDEVAKNMLALKDMKSGNQESLSLNDAITKIRVK